MQFMTDSLLRKGYFLFLGPECNIHEQTSMFSNTESTVLSTLKEEYGQQQYTPSHVLHLHIQYLSRTLGLSPNLCLILLVMKRFPTNLRADQGLLVVTSHT